MGCGSSSQPTKRDTRAQSQVTVAAQQRAEAAYRRQRMAQERAEQTAVWRAEMEVERARMLKEMTGGSSRRSSYCKELEDLKERAPEVSDHLNGYHQDYKVRTRNARNSLPVNAYPHSTVISQRRGSREEREKRAYYRQKEQENDKNENGHRRFSTGEKIDLDFLRIIANRSSQTSPSNVQIEENVPDRDEAQSLDINAEQNENVPLKGNDGVRSEESKKNEDEALTEKAGVSNVSKEHVAHNSVDSQVDVTPTDNEYASSTHEDPVMVHDNSETADHSNVERSSDTDAKNVAKRFKQEADVNSDSCNNNNKASEISVDFNEEQSQISNTVDEEPEKQVGG